MLEVNSAAAAGLPLWAQALSAAVAALLGGVTLFGFFRRGKVEARITHDSYFVFCDSGEIFVCQCVLLARYGPVLIRDVKIELKMEPSSSKWLRLQVINFGEKTPGQPVMNQTYYGSSPETYIPAEVPQRLFFWSVEPKHHLNWTAKMDRFKSDMEAIASRHSAGVIDRLTAEGEIREAARNLHPLLTSEIQLEDGTYSAKITVQYECPGHVGPRKRKSDSEFNEFSFVIERDKVNSIRQRLGASLEMYGRGVVLGGSGLQRLWPEYHLLRPLALDHEPPRGHL